MMPARRPRAVRRRRVLARALACVVLALIATVSFAPSGQASSPPGAPPRPGRGAPAQPGTPPGPAPGSRHDPGSSTEAGGGFTGAGAPVPNRSAESSPAPSGQPGSSTGSGPQNGEAGRHNSEGGRQHTEGGRQHSEGVGRHSEGGSQHTPVLQNTTRQREAPPQQVVLPRPSPRRTQHEKQDRGPSPKKAPKGKPQTGQSPPASLGQTITPTTTFSAPSAPASGSTTPAASAPSSAQSEAPATSGALALPPLVAGHSLQTAGPSGHGGHAESTAHPALLTAAGLAGAPALGAARRAGALVPLAALGAVPAGEAAAALAPAPKHPRGGPRGHGGGGGRQSPLATTITRIVDVVPTPVRVLFGVLLALALGLAVRAWLAARRGRRLEHQRAQLLADVGLLQAALLPIVPDRVGPVATSAAYRPAAGPAAGGDFYDMFALEDGRLAVIVGDISGHGRDALPHTALVRYTLRAYLEAGLAPRAAIQTAGAVLDRQLGDSFATVLAATYQPRERQLVYASAGHPPPMILGSQPLAAVTVSSAPPLGAGMRTGTRQTVVSLPGHAQVCLHTDGVTEARVGAELFGSARLQHTLAELGPDDTAATLLDRVAGQADARPDDMAACLLSIAGGASPPATLVEELELDRDTATSERTTRFLRACGVGTREAGEVVLAAQAAARRSGTVLLELHTGSGAPEVKLRQDNVTHLRATRASAQDRAAAS
jgi:hypothetical protein